MTDETTFSTRSNAKRAAEKAIRNGSAPSIDYGIKPRDGDRYRFEIVWFDRAQEARDRLGMPTPTAEIIETDIATVTAEAEPSVECPDSDADHTLIGEEPLADKFPPGTRVIVQVTARKRRTGAVDYRVDATSCRVKLDGPMPSVLFRYNQLAPDDGSEPSPLPAKTERRKMARAAEGRKPSKSAELDAAAARGEMPVKPIMTSPTNKTQYQPRFDKLEAMAKAGDWDGVRAYEIKGINSYAKMVKQYRERLLAAHAASTASSEAA